MTPNLGMTSNPGKAIVVFAGPSLPASDVTTRLSCILLPPAGQGDLWRAVRRHRPMAIGLIDGVFRGRRAVWHREILWALSQGIHVLGAASMGALRAAELHGFGMRGIGRVFEAYRSGFWPGYDEPFEDDDEVAVEHAPAELGHAPLSTAMVDLRDTLLAAEAAGVMDRDERLRLTAMLKGAPYADRGMDGLEAVAGRSLARCHVARKRLDALELLEALPEVAAGDGFHPDFEFQRTMIWDRFVSDAERALREGDDPAAVAAIDQLRLDPAAWRAACLAAHGRAVTRPEPPDDLGQALSLFRINRGLGRRADLDGWMMDNALDEAGLLALLRTDPDHVPGAPSVQALADELRASGRFAALHAAALRAAPHLSDVLSE